MFFETFLVVYSPHTFCVVYQLALSQNTQASRPLQGAALISWMTPTSFQFNQIPTKRANVYSAELRSTCCRRSVFGDIVKCRQNYRDSFFFMFPKFAWSYCLFPILYSTKFTDFHWGSSFVLVCLSWNCWILSSTEMDLKDPNKVNCQNVCTQKNMLISVMANISIKTSWCIRYGIMVL